jgi:hypothetical protein
VKSGGVDVIITIFGDVLPTFGEENWRFSKKTYFLIKFLPTLIISLSKTNAKFFGENNFKIVFSIPWYS